MKVYDAKGNLKNWVWVLENYNVIWVECPKTAPHWELAELHESIGPSSMTVRLVGDTIFAVPVAFYWPDAPQPSDPSEPKPVKVVQFTNAEGQTGFGMGPGAFYRPPAIGPHAIWISEYPRCASDLVDGLGMIAGTNHAHLEPTFQFAKAEELPPSEGKVFRVKFEGVLTIEEG